jgi:hypothetical protein
MVNYMDRQVVAAVVEPMKAALKLHRQRRRILGSVFLLSASPFFIPRGVSSRPMEQAQAIAIMAVLWSGFTFLTSKAWNFWSLFVPRSLSAW